MIMLDYFLHLFKSSFKISICLPWRTSGRKAGILTRDLLLHNLTPQVPWWRSTVCHSCAAVHVQPHLWCRNPLPNAAASLRTDQNSVAVTACLLSEDTRRLEWSGAKSIRYSMNIMYTVEGPLSPNKICSALEREAELWHAFGFLEQHTFSNQIRLNDRSS